MAITLDQLQIDAALNKFEIKNEEYYLLFDNQVIYMIWCTTGAKALQHVTENSCVSLEIKDQWVYSHNIPVNYVPPTYTCVRYILATD